MRLIDADALMTWFKNNYDDDEDVSVGYVSGIIEEQPEAIVRCRDCKYQSKGSNEVDAWDLCIFRPWLYIQISDYYFCNFGERRTDE